MSEGYIQEFTSDFDPASNSNSQCAESEHTKQIRNMLKLENEADQNLYKYMLMRRGSDVQTIYRMINAFDLWPLLLVQTDLQIGLAPKLLSIKQDESCEPVPDRPEIYAMARQMLVNLNNDLFNCWFPYVFIHLNTGADSFNKTRLENDTSLLIALKIRDRLCVHAWRANPVNFRFRSNEMSYVYGIRVMASWVEVVMAFTSYGNVTIVPIFALPITDPDRYLQFISILFKMKDNGPIRKSIIENWLWCLERRIPISLIERIIKFKPSTAPTFQPLVDSARTKSLTQARLESAQRIDGNERLDSWLQEVYKARHPYALSP
uniref:Uncharacterized protein n=1 Tax=Kwoniella bestiolae CBS 10118 TaxID=1296100 RepID=A0A1B9GAF9_9TREE|nr:hypothetical protein I302_02853 [Kwoniella bestiolae CBS 10118]OCF28003.1 hypothetical protein I302_02853 [Kwoniella bestiolae CBS 10118]